MRITDENPGIVSAIGSPTKNFPGALRPALNRPCSQSFGDFRCREWSEAFRAMGKSLHTYAQCIQKAYNSGCDARFLAQTEIDGD